MKIDCHVHVNNFYRRNKLDSLVDEYKDSDLDGLVCTDHFKARDFKSGALTLERFWAPYYELQKYSDFIALPGAEVNVGGQDYLVYGLEPPHFKPILGIGSVFDLRKYVHTKGGLVIQAHPGRAKRGKSRVKLDFEVDGYEALNGHPKHENRNGMINDIALVLRKLRLAGSDCHNINGAARTWLDTGDYPATTTQELVTALISGHTKIDGIPEAKAGVRI